MRSGSRSAAGRRGAAALALALALGAGAEAAAQTSACRPYLLGADRRGPAHALARSGTRVYLGAGAALVVIDAADPLHPLERGYANLGGVVRDVASWGSTAIALGPEALEFVDAADPAQPRVVGRHPLPAEWDVRTIDARDALVFLTAPDGLHIVDFTDPAAPEEIGTSFLAEAADVAARSGRAYLLAASTLHVLDTTDPSAPLEIAAVSVPLQAADHVTLAPGGSRLATWGADSSIGHSWGEVAFFDLTDPDLPVLRSRLYFYEDDPPGSVALDADHAYVVHEGGVPVYDLSDLAAPVLAGTAAADVPRQPLAADDPDYLLVADEWTGFRVYDVAPPSFAHEVASVATPGEALDGYFQGELAVVAHRHGLRVFDLTAPSRPLAVASWSDPLLWLGTELARVGSFAYAQVNFIPGGANAFGILDLSDPGAPSLVGTFGDGLAWMPVIVDRGLAVHPLGPPSPLLDVSAPALPVAAGALTNLGTYVFDASLYGGRAFAFTQGSSQPIRLWAFDVSQPATPVDLGMTPLADGGRSAVRGTVLFVSGGTSLASFDVADPAHVVPLGSLPLPVTGTARRISLFGSRAALDPDSSEWGAQPAFRVVELADPAHPALIDLIRTADNANHVFAGPGLIGVADGEAGFALYESCVPFADGFESGDAAAWSSVQP